MTKASEEPIKESIAKGKRQGRKSRRALMLSVSRELFQQFHARARAEGMPLTVWFARIARQELRRKPSV